MILFGYRIPNFFSLIIWGCLWELVGQSKITYFVPSLSEILKAFLEIYNTEVFLKALFEKNILISIGSAQHPNADQNIQQGRRGANNYICRL